jgi:hypothetical protein
MLRMPRYTPDQSQVEIPGSEKRPRKAMGEATPR